MIELNGNEVIGKCTFCGELITQVSKHYLINRGLHLYYMCPKCYSDMVLVMGDENGNKKGKVN